MSDANVSEAQETSTIVHATVAAIEGDSVQLAAGDQRWTGNRADIGKVEVGSQVDVYVDAAEGAKPPSSRSRMADVPEALG